MQWEEHQRLPLKALWATPGLVDVYISRDGLHTYVVLAERHDNTAASVTNAYEIYARQVCDLFNIDPKRTVFLELYVKPTFNNNQVKMKYELDVCTPSMSGLDNRETNWRPSQPAMKKEILDSLCKRVELTSSYRVPVIL